VSENYKDDLIQYRLDRAQETYDEAVLMKRERHWNTCANRLYYFIIPTIFVGMQSGRSSVLLFKKLNLSNRYKCAN
jgi:hypothetical protein